MAPKPKPAISRLGSDLLSTPTVPPTSVTSLDLDALQAQQFEAAANAQFAPSSYVAPIGEDVYLRVKIPMPGLEAVVSTVKVTTDTYLADILEAVCQKRKEQLGDHKQWVLMLGDQDLVVPLDRTVDSLQGSYNLRLVKRSEVTSLMKAMPRYGLENTNPSASIFKVRGYFFSYITANA